MQSAPVIITLIISSEVDQYIFLMFRRGVNPVGEYASFLVRLWIDKETKNLSELVGQIQHIQSGGPQKHFRGVEGMLQFMAEYGFGPAAATKQTSATEETPLHKKGGEALPHISE